jgi:phosphatidylethanolamine-binding protein (PEBP) family uncharacterized protein
MKLKIKQTIRHKNRRNNKSRKKIIKGGNNLVVKYKNKILLGQKLTKSETSFPPSINFSSQLNKLYCLIMWDPDVPTQIQPGFLHWLVTNLESQNDIINNQLITYKGPSPPSGTHRYFFGLFEQTGHILSQPIKRQNFSIEEFINKNKLRKIVEVFMIVSAAEI